MLNDNGAGWSLGRGSNGGATMGSQGPNQQSRGASNQNGIANTMNMNLWGNDDTDAMSSWSGDNNGMGSWSAEDNDAMVSWTNDDDNNGMPSLDMNNNNVTQSVPPSLYYVRLHEPMSARKQYDS